MLVRYTARIHSLNTQLSVHYEFSMQLTENVAAGRQINIIYALNCHGSSQDLIVHLFLVHVWNDWFLSLEDIKCFYKIILRFELDQISALIRLSVSIAGNVPFLFTSSNQNNGMSLDMLKFTFIPIQWLIIYLLSQYTNCLGVNYIRKRDLSIFPL